MGGGPSREIETRRGKGLMPASTTTIIANPYDWQYQQQVFVKPPVEELPSTPEVEELPEVEPLAGVDEYGPLKLETHDSYSARLARRKD